MMQDGGLNCKGGLLCVVIVIEYFLDFFFLLFLLVVLYILNVGRCLPSLVRTRHTAGKQAPPLLPPLRVVAQSVGVRVVREITLRPRGLKALRRL